MERIILPLEECKKIKIENKSTSKGDLLIIEGNIDCPFDIKRSYILNKIPNGVIRGEHAHKKLKQLFIILNGSFKVILDDGSHKAEFILSNSNEALLVTQMIWRRIESLCDGSTCLVLASLHYDEGDYIRNYDVFIELTQNERNKKSN